MLKHFTATSSNKLKQLTFSDKPEDMNIKILWISSVPFHENSEHINRKLHCHSFYEAHFIINGALKFEASDGHIIELSAEEGILFSPQTRHVLKEMEPNTIRFTMAFLPDPDNTLNTLLSRENYYHFSVTSRLIDCIDIILYEITQQNTFSATLIQNRLFEIICELTRSIGIAGHFKCSHDNPSDSLIILKAKQYISDNRDKQLDCAEVAGYCHYNVRYLSRIFARQTGQTLLEYIHNEKIKYAETLLEDDTLTLKQVSEMLGFANEYYFNSFFKRKNGTSPGKYRQLLKNK